MKKPMTDEEIWKRAQELAHENSPACRNRPAIYAGIRHGKSCKKLANTIAKAMLEARGDIDANTKLRRGDE